MGFLCNYSVFGGRGGKGTFFHQYRIPGCLTQTAVEKGLQARSPARFSFLCFFYLIQYRIPDLSFVLRGRRIEGLAGAKPLYELPRLLRALLGLVFTYGSLGC